MDDSVTIATDPSNVNILSTGQKKKSLIASKNLLHLVLSKVYWYICTAFRIHCFHQLIISNDSTEFKWIVSSLAAFTYCVITNREDSQIISMVK